VQLYQKIGDSYQDNTAPIYAAFQSGVHAIMYMCVPAGPVHTSLLVTDWYMVSATLLTWTGAHRWTNAIASGIPTARNAIMSVRRKAKQASTC